MLNYSFKDKMIFSIVHLAKGGHCWCHQTDFLALKSQSLGAFEGPQDAVCLPGRFTLQPQVEVFDGARRGVRSS